jgi:hypothetical protein
MQPPEGLENTPFTAATLKGLVEFQIKISRPLFAIIFESKMLVSRPEILVYLF